MSPYTTKELFINTDTFGEDESLLGFMWIFCLFETRFCYIARIYLIPCRSLWPWTLCNPPASSLGLYFRSSLCWHLLLQFDCVCVAWILLWRKQEHIPADKNKFTPRVCLRITALGWNTMTKAKLERKRFIWLMFLLFIIVGSKDRNSDGAGIWSKKLMQRL